MQQRVKAPSHIPQVGSSKLHPCIAFEHMQPGDKTADSALLRSVHADAEEMMRSACEAAYRVTGDAT